MISREDALERILEALETSTGEHKKLACAKAFALNKEFGISLKRISEICNSEGIKIVGCQLGCFL